MVSAEPVMSDPSKPSLKEEVRCRTCLFFRKINDSLPEGADGECMYHPPTVTLLHQQIRSERPLVGKEDFCGHHSANVWSFNFDESSDTEGV